MTFSGDPTLYAGSAEHYARGRRPYPPALATAVRDELGLDGTGRLLDVGCGPGSLTVVLAPLFAAALGVDADAGMLTEAARRAPGIQWRQLMAEELPAGLGTFRMVSFAQSFHWMNQRLVADRMREMIEPGGAWVHVGASTQRGVGGEFWDRVDELIWHYLGPVRRAGGGIVLPPGAGGGVVLRRGAGGGEEDVMRAAGYQGPVRLEIPGETVVRGVNEIVDSVFSLSSSTPRLFGDRREAFEDDLRELLLAESPDGRFTEWMRETAVVIWRP
jgi:hypothetical protein